jgi:hypothetical protein
MIHHLFPISLSLTSTFICIFGCVCTIIHFFPDSFKTVFCHWIFLTFTYLQTLHEYPRHTQCGADQLDTPAAKKTQRCSKVKCLPQNHVRIKAKILQILR